MKQWEMQFDEAVKTELINELDELEGEVLYLYEIPDRILETDIADGCKFHRAGDKEFINNNWWAAGDTYEYLKKQGLEPPNPFDDSGRFVVDMFYMGLNKLLQKSAFVNENWNEEQICLDEDTINLILEEVGIERERETEQEQDLGR